MRSVIPLHEYKSEAFQLFEHMLGRLRRDVTGQLMHVVLTQRAPEEFIEMPLPEMQPHHFDPLTGEDEFLAEEQEAAPKSRQQRRAAAKQGNGAPPAPRKAGGRDGAAPGGKPQQAKGRGQRGPAEGLQSIPATLQAGARSRAMRCAPAAPARSSSIVTERSLRRLRNNTSVQEPVMPPVGFPSQTHPLRGAG